MTLLRRLALFMLAACGHPGYALLAFGLLWELDIGRSLGGNFYHVSPLVLIASVLLLALLRLGLLLGVNRLRRAPLPPAAVRDRFLCHHGLALPGLLPFVFMLLPFEGNAAFVLIFLPALLLTALIAPAVFVYNLALFVPWLQRRLPFWRPDGPPPAG